MRHRTPAGLRLALLCLLTVGSGLRGLVHGQTPLAERPPMGWNSFDSYGLYLHHDAALKAVKAMAERYLPFGYDYFVIDAGWFGEYELVPGTLYPREKHARDVHIDEYGLLQPSECYFPHGLKPIIDSCHARGLKFGLHLMRGIPRKAVEHNTRIKGTPYFARQIADTTSVCSWCPQNYGVDMTRPGAQEFYDSLVAQLAEWGVDFIKADDIVPYPAEVEAMSEAIRRCGRPIILSLSPGGSVSKENLSSFRQATMLRVTPDVWDERRDLDACFTAWRKWQGAQREGFYIDMDMIPFGELQIMAPRPEGVSPNESKAQIQRRKLRGELSGVELLSGKGWHRRCRFTPQQHRTFITLRALSASPLFIGGDPSTMDDQAYALLTNPDMIACNQNGIMGRPVAETDGTESWYTASPDGKRAWIGIFNRQAKESREIVLDETTLGIEAAAFPTLYDIWGQRPLEKGERLSIAPDDVVFIRLTRP